jgi:FkbM family methyltransferase
LKRLLRKTATALVPRRYRLPIAYWKHRATGGIEPEILFARRWRNRGPLAVDIGANSGLYTYELSRWFKRVECYEPNPLVSQTIRDWNRPNITLHLCGLSSGTQDATLHVPVSPTGVHYAGWGTLDASALGAGNRSTYEVKLKTFDSAALTEVAFIKIDVEGHESEVLIGGRETIEKCRPVLLVEAKIHSRNFIHDYFDRICYTLYCLTGTQLAQVSTLSEWPRENVFCVPNEVVAQC